MRRRSLSSGPLGHDWTELAPSAIETGLPTAATPACGTDRWTPSRPLPPHAPVANRATTLGLPSWRRTSLVLLAYFVLASCPRPPPTSSCGHQFLRYSGLLAYSAPLRGGTGSAR